MLDLPKPVEATKQVNFTIPVSMLEEVDGIATKNNVSRSETIKALVKFALSKVKEDA